MADQDKDTVMSIDESGHQKLSATDFLLLLEHIGFDPRGFKHFAFEVNYVPWIRELNKKRDKAKCFPLSREAHEKLWPILVNWYFTHWCPADPIVKTQKSLNKALDKPSRLKEKEAVFLNDYFNLHDWVYEEVYSTREKGFLTKYWADEDFLTVIAYLDEQASKYPGQFDKNRVPIYVKPSKAQDPAVVIQKKMENLNLDKKPKYTKKRAREEVAEGDEEGTTGGVGAGEEAGEGKKVATGEIGEGRVIKKMKKQ